MKKTFKALFQKDISLVVFSDFSHTPKKYFLSKKLLLIGTFSTLFLIIGMSAFSYFLYQENLHIERLTKSIKVSKKISSNEMERQKSDITKIANYVNTISQELNELKKIDNKVRIITALGVKENSFFGKGGPEDRDFIDIHELIEDNHTQRAIEFLKDDISRLTEMSKVQKESFEELNIYLNKQNSILASTPSIWPVKGWITSGFGYRSSPFNGIRKMHEGIDIVAKRGTPVIAPAAGVVVKAGRVNGYGLLVEIKHGYGLLTKYGHNSKLLVKEGQKVKRGQIISKVGSSGRSTGPHLHYEVVLNGVPINPLNYIIN
ncbi:MAG: M23 family metallopeptidase [Nitrospinae bacterium]|nr:M23 family metallopeptidase [Nitrospinota bacterium]